MRRVIMRRFSLSSTILLSLSLSACSFISADELVIEDGGDATPAALGGKNDQVTIAFTAVEDEVDAPGEKPVTKIITSARAYRELFGHDAPGVSFDSEWVVYYSGGFQSTSGHVAKVRSIGYSASEHRLEIVTAFESPGPGCESFAVPELPYALVKFAAPLEAESVRIFRDDSLRDCTSATEPPTPIAADCSARGSGAMITIENVDDAAERYTGWFTQPAFIDEAKRLLAEGESRVPSFAFLDGTDCDGNWSWHLDAIDAHFADFTIEVCDAIPSHLQANKDAWLASKQRWCPWGAKVIAVDDRR